MVSSAGSDGENGVVVGQQQGQLALDDLTLTLTGRADNGEADKVPPGGDNSFGV